MVRLLIIGQQPLAWFWQHVPAEWGPSRLDHDQHPEVGGGVTVVHAENDPGRAIVLGYESDGVWFRGVGVVLTVIFGVLGFVFTFVIGSAVLRARFRKPASEQTA